MIKDKVLNLINLCLEIQRGKDGTFESRISSKPCPSLTNDRIGPTVFFKFSGQICNLEIGIFKNGWGCGADCGEIFDFYLDEETNEEKLEHCKAVLEEIVRKQKEKEQK